jgi:hypothetical protein
MAMAMGMVAAKVWLRSNCACVRDTCPDRLPGQVEAEQQQQAAGGYVTFTAAGAAAAAAAAAAL